MKIKKLLLLTVLLAVPACSVKVKATEEVNSTANFSWNYDMEPEGYNDLDWSYQYETQIYGYEKLVGAYYQGEYYTYTYNENGIIDGIKDSDGNQIVKYTYDQNGILSCVFSYENEEWIENNDPTFIGNKNKMLSSGMYFDDNTKCYYISQRYYNPVLDQWMDGVENDAILYAETNPYYSLSEEDEVPFSSGESDLAAQQWADQLLENDKFGTPVEIYSNDWYSSLSNVEVLARTIYGEGGTESTIEDRAVAWVILNRLNSRKFQSTPVAIVKAKGQFEALTGGERQTENARIPMLKSDRWKESTYLACLLLTTTSETEWRTIVGNPINGQLYFYSYTVALDSFKEGNSIFTGTTSNTLKCEGQSIYNVYVRGYGYVSSFPALFTNLNSTNYSKNIYYDR